MPVIELATLKAKPGHGDELGRALPEALAVIAGLDGCLGVSCLRCIERPDEFVARVEWVSIADHEAFRAGPGLGRFRAPIAAHYDGATALGHFTQIALTPAVSP